MGDSQSDWRPVWSMLQHGHKCLSLCATAHSQHTLLSLQSFSSRCTVWVWWLL